MFRVYLSRLIRNHCAGTSGLARGGYHTDNVDDHFHTRRAELMNCGNAFCNSSSSDGLVMPGFLETIVGIGNDSQILV